MKIGDLVEIEWDDHCSYTGGGWLKREKEYKPCVCRTVGYVIAINRKTITVTSTYDTADDGGDQMISGYCTRLRSAITRSKILKGIGK